MIDTKIHNSFLLLVIFQGFHSIEEYIGKLWEVFPPATMLCSLFSEDLEKAFIILNSGLFILGLFGWVFIVRKMGSYARGFIWFWVFLELINGFVHLVYSSYNVSYTPGLFTAPFLLITAAYLAWSLRSNRIRSI